MVESLDEKLLKDLIKIHIRKLHWLFLDDPLPYKKIRYRMKILLNLYNQLDKVKK